jgi:hypothetical protein
LLVLPAAVAAFPGDDGRIAYVLGPESAETEPDTEIFTIFRTARNGNS